ncbi:carnitine 3-dehydrogenase [Phenylobacterium sp. Root700]|uniref:carnitine 3-dehydrogenase n=1 Tax=Phenylobacterium sp. Root700 TaxID=1736591 RepID=UPI0006F4542F|nr:carnitine 3-dehydrogenase [Phenylobacterium sp. Root700]KRB48818.1 3-hydroxyacyl-CoA dehydrogenase [Phenylobacterium sp. Root700]
MASETIRRVALIGGGVIGAGWAARFLLNGLDVVMFDLDPEAERKVATVLDSARVAWTALYPGLLPAEGRLSFAGSIAEAVKGAGFVQESLPEREDLKRRVLAELDALLPPEVVIGSSTSGLLPTSLQSDMAHPERLVVGHPFNPVYLLPLVEICGGARTSDAAKAAAAELYERIGMQVLHVRKEIDGFIADRLLEAVWREGLWLINDGIATTAELDDAIRFGAGLRWSFMGTFLTYRLAGGEAGMRHFLDQFGPALKLPWTKLEAPELTDSLADRIAVQSDEQADGVSIRDLERLRDKALVSVLQGLRATDVGAGATLERHMQQLRRALPEPVSAPVDEAAPLRLHRAAVLPEWIDYNGHMTEHRYLQVFGDATDALLGYIGAGADYVAGGHSFYTVETHIRHLQEVKLGVPLTVETQVIGGDAKRLHVFHSLFAAANGDPLATAEQMLLHVDNAASRAVPAQGDVLARLDRLRLAQASLAPPEGAGRSIGARSSAPASESSRG